MNTICFVWRPQCPLLDTTGLRYFSFQYLASPDRSWWVAPGHCLQIPAVTRQAPLGAPLCLPCCQPVFWFVDFVSFFTHNRTHAHTWLTTDSAFLLGLYLSYINLHFFRIYSCLVSLSQFKNRAVTPFTWVKLDWDFSLAFSGIRKFHISCTPPNLKLICWPASF